LGGGLSLLWKDNPLLISINKDEISNLMIEDEAIITVGWSLEMESAFRLEVNIGSAVVMTVLDSSVLVVAIVSSLEGDRIGSSVSIAEDS